MKARVPRRVRIGALSYGVKFTPHMKLDDDLKASCNQRTGIIQIDPDCGQIMNLAFLHEVVHMIDINYGCGLDEPTIDRLAHGISEFIEKDLFVELDWSQIE